VSRTFNTEENPHYLLSQLHYHRAKSITSDALREAEVQIDLIEKSILSYKVDLSLVEKEILQARSFLEMGRYDRIAFREISVPLFARKDSISRDVFSLEKSVQSLRDKAFHLSQASARSVDWLQNITRKVQIYSLVQIDAKDSESDEWLILPRGMSFRSRSRELQTVRVDTPFAAACLGKEKGTITTYLAPTGTSHSIQITNVRISPDFLLEEIIQFATTSNGRIHFVDERYRVHLTQPEPRDLGQDPPRRKNDP